MGKHKVPPLVSRSRGAYDNRTPVPGDTNIGMYGQRLQECCALLGLLSTSERRARACEQAMRERRARACGQDSGVQFPFPNSHFPIPNSRWRAQICRNGANYWSCRLQASGENTHMSGAHFPIPISQFPIPVRARKSAGAVRITGAARCKRAVKLHTRVGPISQFSLACACLLERREITGLHAACERRDYTHEL